jgi:serine/threonine-protein kinase ULK/ATG1
MAGTAAGHRPQLPDFVFTDKLGSGTYATVYKAYRKSATEREVVAVKCISKASLNRTSTENLLTEIELLKTLRHEHIVHLIDFRWDDQYIYLIMEYCGGGDLSKFIRDQRILPENIARLLLQQLASALQYMRTKHVSHMDLKPQNILLSSTSNPRLKIADFGFAHYLIGDDVETANGLRGSLLYMAPELLTRQQYNEKADLWSVGIILYECLFGRPPFASKSLKELEDRIFDKTPIEIPRNVHISSDCRSLLRGLLQRNPDERISYDNFFAHPFVDLEHRPCDGALQKATELIRLAVDNDTAHKYVEAVNLYCQAISYFIPAIQYETDARKKHVIREKVKEYISRAEELKRLMKPCAQPAIAETNVCLQPFDELVTLSANNKQLSDALRVICIAMTKEESEDYIGALEKYEIGLEALIKLLPDEPRGRRKELLQAEMSKWMSRAEVVKDYVSVKDLPAESVGRNEEDVNAFDISSCTVQ